MSLDNEKSYPSFNLKPQQLKIKHVTKRKFSTILFVSLIYLPFKYILFIIHRNMVDFLHRKEIQVLF